MDEQGGRRALDRDHAANIILFMSTTVHIPARLLSRVDARARARGISRNRLIVEALEGSLGARTSWPPELVSMLGQPLDARAASELAASLKAVRARRTRRRKAPSFDR